MQPPEPDGSSGPGEKITHTAQRAATPAVMPHRPVSKQLDDPHFPISRTKRSVA
jgi:hypothetical protein